MQIYYHAIQYAGITRVIDNWLMLTQQRHTFAVVIIIIIINYYYVVMQFFYLSFFNPAR